MLSMSCRQTLSLQQTLSAAQRQQIIQSQTLKLRLELIGSFHGGVKYEPRGNCPSCGRKLTPLEILKGFNADPNDFTTACSGCTTRFQPQLVWSNNIARIELPFLCALQTEAKLAGFKHLSPEEFEIVDPSLYHSAIAHFGLLKNAYAGIGITYGYDEVADMKKKVEGFLGKLPDTVIAEVTGLKVNVVRRMRKTAHISPFSQAAMIEDAGEY